jgi:hypothetical protein
MECHSFACFFLGLYSGLQEIVSWALKEKNLSPFGNLLLSFPALMHANLTVDWKIIPISSRL